MVAALRVGVSEQLLSCSQASLNSLAAPSQPFLIFITSVPIFYAFVIPNRGYQSARLELGDCWLFSDSPRSENIWRLLLQPATRGQSLCFGLTFWGNSKICFSSLFTFNRFIFFFVLRFLKCFTSYSFDNLIFFFLILNMCWNCCIMCTERWKDAPKTRTKQFMEAMKELWGLFTLVESS